MTTKTDIVAMAVKTLASKSEEVDNESQEIYGQFSLQSGIPFIHQYNPSTVWYHSAALQ